jgi:DNA-binding MarR family transcriptional regulator
MAKTARKRRSATATGTKSRGRVETKPFAALGEVSLDPPLEFLRQIWALDHNLHVSSKRMATIYGITGPQRLVVRLIGKYPTVSAGELARVLHVHKSTITGIVQRLEAHGLVQRATDAADARRIRLTLTAAGRKVSGSLSGTAEAAVRRVLANTDTRSVEATRRVLDRLATELLGKK